MIFVHSASHQTLAGFQTLTQVTENLLARSPSKARPMKTYRK